MDPWTRMRWRRRWQRLRPLIMATVLAAIVVLILLLLVQHLNGGVSEPLFAHPLGGGHAASRSGPCLSGRLPAHHDHLLTCIKAMSLKQPKTAHMYVF